MSNTNKNFLDLEGLSRYDEKIKNYIPVTHGYYNNGNFYEDSSFTILITGESKRLYVSLNTDELYEYYNNIYNKIRSDGSGKDIIVSSTEPVNQSTGDIWFKIE